VWRRRGLLIGAAAAAAIVLPTAGGILAPNSPLDAAGTPAAVAEDGRLDCGTGTAEAVEPSAVEPRYLPSALPDGLDYVSLTARDETGRGWCVPPSLTALETGADDQVDATLKVYGPFDVSLDDGGMGAATVSTVAGHEARLFVLDEAVSLYRWYWTDDTGQTWLAEVDGYPLEQATTVVDGLTTTGDRVSWAGAPDSGTGAALDVVHERTGDPYTLDSHRQSWYVEVSDGERSFEIIVDQSLDNHAVPLYAHAPVGARLTTVDGYDVIQEAAPSGTGDHEGIEGEEPLAAVQVQLAPGVTARTAAPTTELGTELLTSLELAPQDDARIQEHGSL
jgi:hypothetical protein